jgi:CspA family cold shock protein
MKGIVKRFYFRKGFGFVEGDQGTEYFFHYSDFNGDKQDLRPGLEVEFEPQQGEKGPCAVAVVLTGGKPAAQRPQRAPRNAPKGAKTAAHPGRYCVFGLVVGLLIGAAVQAWLSSQ